MSELPPDAFVPVPLHWRYVAPGDVFVAPDGRLWHVRATDADGPLGRNVVSAEHGKEAHTAAVDPDNTISVLVPVTERDAVELCREELGARLTGQRTV